MQAKGPGPSQLRSALPPWQQARGSGPRADAHPSGTPPSGMPLPHSVVPTSVPTPRVPPAFAREAQPSTRQPAESAVVYPHLVVAPTASQANDVESTRVTPQPPQPTNVERTQIYVHPAALKPPAPLPPSTYAVPPQHFAPGAPPYISGPPTGSPFAGVPSYAPPPGSASRPAPATPSGRGAVMFLGVVIMLSALVVAGALPKVRRGEAQAVARAEATAPRRVLVRRVSSGPKQVNLTLPATASALRSTAVHAKTTGYVRDIGVDIGERVKAGHLLARLEIPETEQERQVAQARLDEANSNARLVQEITEKQTRLAESGALSVVEGDEARLRQSSARASVRATRAEVRRLDAINAYQRVVAPFDGVVTKRLVDPGALVGSGGGALFEISDVSTLRVFVDVPQSLAAAVAGGLEAEVVVPRSQAEPVKGKVVRSAGALDPTLRTLRTEIHIPGNGAVLAGSFVNVRLKLPNDKALPALPASALIVRKEGTFVATLSDDDRVHLAPVKLGRDLGKEIELIAGADEGQRVVGNPPDDLTEGEKVRTVEPPPAEAPSAAKPLKAPDATGVWREGGCGSALSGPQGVLSRRCAQAKRRLGQHPLRDEPDDGVGEGVAKRPEAHPELALGLRRVEARESTLAPQRTVALPTEQHRPARQVGPSLVGEGERGERRHRHRAPGRRHPRDVFEQRERLAHVQPAAGDEVALTPPTALGRPHVRESDVARVDVGEVSVDDAGQRATRVVEHHLPSRRGPGIAGAVHEAR